MFSGIGFSKIGRGGKGAASAYSHVEIDLLHHRFTVFIVVVPVLGLGIGLDHFGPVGYVGLYSIVAEAIGEDVIIR